MSLLFGPERNRHNSWLKQLVVESMIVGEDDTTSCGLCPQVYLELSVLNTVKGSEAVF